MNHDPMCPQYDCWLEGCTVCDECALIARVREDERDKAGERVASLLSGEFPGTPAYLAMFANYREYVIAAASDDRTIREK